MQHADSKCLIYGSKYNHLGLIVVFSCQKKNNRIVNITNELELKSQPHTSFEASSEEFSFAIFSKSIHLTDSMNISFQNGQLFPTKKDEQVKKKVSNERMTEKF